MRELIERLEMLTAPDREVDCDIAVSVLGLTKTNRREKWPGLEPFWDFTDDRTKNSGSAEVMVRRFTGSVDAAIALAEKVLPTMNCYGFDKTADLGVEANVQRNGVKDGHWAYFAEHSSSPAIALCLAVLKAVAGRDALKASEGDG